jgi:hypothetical protein
VIIGVIERRTKRNYVHATAIGDGRYALHAGLVKLVRHACAPNCGVRVNQQGGHDVVAMRDLDEDEEILIDYAMRNYDLDAFAWRCRCGAPSCRGVITGWRGLPAATRKAYRKFAAPYVLVCAARAEAAP